MEYTHSHTRSYTSPVMTIKWNDYISYTYTQRTRKYTHGITYVVHEIKQLIDTVSCGDTDPIDQLRLLVGDAPFDFLHRRQNVVVLLLVVQLGRFVRPRRQPLLQLLIEERLERFTVLVDLRVLLVTIRSLQSHIRYDKNVPCCKGKHSGTSILCPWWAASFPCSGRALPNPVSSWSSPGRSVSWLSCDNTYSAMQRLFYITFTAEWSTNW